MLNIVKQINRKIPSNFQITEAHLLIQEDEIGQVEGTVSRLIRDLRKRNIKLIPEYAVVSESAKELMKKKKYNLLWSDARMPVRLGENEIEDAGITVLTELYSGKLGNLNKDTDSIIVSVQDVDLSPVLGYNSFLHHLNKLDTTNILKLFTKYLVMDRINNENLLFKESYEGFDIEFSQDPYPLEVFLMSSERALKTFKSFEICSDINYFSMSVTKELSLDSFIDSLLIDGHEKIIDLCLDKKQYSAFNIISIFESGEFRTIPCEFDISETSISIKFQDFIDLLDPIDSEQLVEDENNILKYNSKGIFFAIGVE